MTRPDGTVSTPHGIVSILLALGFSTMLGQVALLREVLVASFGSELTTVLGLGIWLLGTGLGALLPGRPRLRPLLVALGLAIPACLVLARLQRVLLPGTPGAFLGLEQQLVLLALVLLPGGLLSGCLFRGAVALAGSRGVSLATAYSLECVGGLAGGLLGTVLPALGVENGMVAVIAGTVALLPVLRPRWYPALLLGAAAFAGIFPMLGRWAVPGLRQAVDTPYGRVAVVERVGQRSVFVNGALAFESEGTASEEFAHPAALLVVGPSRVLVLGGLAEGVVAEVLKHQPRLVDAVELDARGLAAALAGSLPLRHPGLRLVHQDPRRFVEASRDTYDLILSALPEPDSGQANRVYTREFFMACRERLTGDGLLALRLRMPENLWTPLQLQRGASIRSALCAAFPHVRILPGTETLLLASRTPLMMAPGLLVSRWESRKIETRMVSSPYLSYRFSDDRGPRLTAALEATEAPVNTDVRPVCHPITLLLWLSRFFPRLGLSGLSLGPLAWAPWILVGLWGLLVLPARRSPRGRALLAAATAGFVGMGLEGALLLAFQTRHGVLYLGLGVMLTLFMAGLAAGAWGVDRWLHPRGIAAALGLLCAGCAGILAHPGWLSMPLAGLLLVVTGTLTGGLFAAASRGARDAGTLYAADLVGGCLGALVAGLLLLPFAGMPVTALALAGVALVAELAA